MVRVLHVAQCNCVQPPNAKATSNSLLQSVNKTIL